MGRGVIIALGLSLAANVFLGGFIAGKIASDPRHHRAHHGFDFARGGPEDFADLPPAARDALKRAFLAHREEGAEKRRAAHELHKEFVAALGADRFDRAAAEQIVAKFEAIETSGRAGLAALLVEAADGLPVEDRKALAAHIDRRAKRQREHGDRPPHGQGAPEGSPPTD